MSFSSKGQSAIEYLTTYGWMLLVIAIVGGAIFTTLQNSSQVQEVSGMTNADVQVDDFGITQDDGFEVELLGATTDRIEEVNLSIKDDETGEQVYSCSEQTIPVADEKTVSVSGIEPSENTNTYKIEITYDAGSLEDLTESGSLTGRLDLNETASCNDFDESSSGKKSGSAPSSVWSIAHNSAPNCSSISYNGSGDSNDPYNISNDYQLQCIKNQSLSADYQIVENINASGTDEWNGGKGFNPIGKLSYDYTDNKGFYGSLNGEGHIIRNLTIDRPDHKDSVGLIGYLGAINGSGPYLETLHGEISNLTVENADVEGPDYTGIVSGISEGNISFVGVTGKVDGKSTVGGISGAYSSKDDSAGIKNSYSRVEANGSAYVGGIGGNGSVYYLANQNTETITLNGSNTAGGGGFNSVGFTNSGTISDSYSASVIQGFEGVGGLAGYAAGEIRGSYWNSQLAEVSTAYNGNPTSSQVHELNTDQMQGQSAIKNMSALNFSNSWKIVENPDDYPELAWE